MPDKKSYVNNIVAYLENFPAEDFLSGPKKSVQWTDGRLVPLHVSSHFIFSLGRPIPGKKVSCGLQFRPPFPKRLAAALPASGVFGGRSDFKCNAFLACIMDGVPPCDEKPVFGGDCLRHPAEMAVIRPFAPTPGEEVEYNPFPGCGMREEMAVGRTCPPISPRLRQETFHALQCMQDLSMQNGPRLGHVIGNIGQFRWRFGGLAHFALMFHGDALSLGVLHRRDATKHSASISSLHFLALPSRARCRFIPPAFPVPPCHAQ